jgi:hypothetical protein
VELSGGKRRAVSFDSGDRFLWGPTAARCCLAHCPPPPNAALCTGVTDGAFVGGRANYSFRAPTGRPARPKQNIS